jgi:hypothetical protein
MDCFELQGSLLQGRQYKDSSSTAIPACGKDSCSAEWARGAYPKRVN